MYIINSRETLLEASRKVGLEVHGESVSPAKCSTKTRFND